MDLRATFRLDDLEKAGPQDGDIRYLLADALRAYVSQGHPQVNIILGQNRALHLADILEDSLMNDVLSTPTSMEDD